MEEKKEHEHHKKNFIDKLTNKVRENPWVLATFIVSLLGLALLVFSLSLTGNSISADSAGEKLLAYYTAAGIEGLSVDSVEEVSGLYKINFEYQDSIIPFYVTKDGKSFIAGDYISQFNNEEPESSSTETQEIPKSEKPSVELYVFTYCPYGLQMEKAAIPAIKLLKDKVDFKIRQIGAMHDPSGCSGTACYESYEAKRQLCIEKYYPDKFLDYVLAFAESTNVGSCQADDACLKPLLASLYKQLNIDEKKINSCIASESDALYKAEVSNSNSKGISGSPTVLINGVSASMSRSPEAVKGAICEAFTTTPEECSTVLSTTASAAGFGTGAGSASSAAQC